MYEPHKLIKKELKKFISSTSEKYDKLYDLREGTMNAVINTYDVRKLARQVHVYSLPDLMVSEENDIIKKAKILRNTADSPNVNIYSDIVNIIFLPSDEIKNEDGGFQKDGRFFGVCKSVVTEYKDVEKHIESRITANRMDEIRDFAKRYDSISFIGRVHMEDIFYKYLPKYSDKERSEPMFYQKLVMISEHDKDKSSEKTLRKDSTLFYDALWSLLLIGKFSSEMCEHIQKYWSDEDSRLFRVYTMMYYLTKEAEAWCYDIPAVCVGPTV